MPDKDTKTPTTPTKNPEGSVSESNTNVTTASNPLGNRKTEIRLNLPVAPILNPKKSPSKNELEQHKTAHQNYISDLNVNLSNTASSIKKTSTYLTSLTAAYQNASSSRNTALTRKLATSISQIKASLEKLNKRKEFIKHNIQEANKTLEELNKHISEVQKGSHESQDKESAKKEDGKPNQAQTTENISAAASGAVVGAIASPTTPQQLSQKTKTLTARDIKKQLKTNLAQNQPKKNIKLIRRGGGARQAISSTTMVEQAQPATATPSIGAPQTAVAIPTPTTTPVKIAAGANIAAAPIQAMGMAKKIAQTVKNIVKTVKNIAKVIKIVTTSATIVGAVANVALLLKDKLKKVLKVIAKIVAGIQALILLMWLWLLAKIAGILAGLAFGLITGLPLLLIPGIGPVLYAGWVGFWTYKGWTDPLATLHIATHPWELITRPAQWIGDQISGWGGAAKGGVDAAAGGVGSITSGVVSTVGNFITGLASAGWGAATSVVGGAASTVGSVASSIWGGLTGGSSAVAGNIASVAVAGGIGTTVTATVLGAFSINSSLYSPALDPKEQFFPPGQNQLFTIRKTADKTQINNPTPLGSENVTFTVLITAADINIKNLQITDAVTTSNGTTPYVNPATNSCQQTNVPAAITAGGNWTCTLVAAINIQQSDATVTNTATLTATSEDGTKTETDSATATVRVGNAPQGCPTGWPTPAGTITQGPQGSTSHYRLYPAEQAIDIAGAAARGTPAYATFSGTVESRHAADDNGYGWYVDISGNCNGQAFIARWAHLETISTSVPPVGSPISGGTQIGTIDATGNVVCSPEPCDASHLHYSFFGLTMGEPYIPPETSW